MRQGTEESGYEKTKERGLNISPKAGRIEGNILTKNLYKGNLLTNNWELHSVPASPVGQEHRTGSEDDEDSTDTSTEEAEGARPKGLHQLAQKWGYSERLAGRRVKPIFVKQSETGTDEAKGASPSGIHQPMEVYKELQARLNSEGDDHEESETGTEKKLKKEA